VLCVLFNSWDDNIYRKRREEMDAKIKENKERTALLKMLEYADRNMGMDDRIRPDDIVMEASKELAELSLENENLKKENAELIFEIGDLKDKLSEAWEIIDSFGFLIFLTKSERMSRRFSFDPTYKRAVKWLREYENGT
jgi:hypothetical protein